MDTGESLTAWTIRFSLLLLIVVFHWQFARPLGQRARSWLRLLWTASFILFVLHVLAAFHFIHHWSHSAAYIATAEETREKMGFAYGAGIYFNYLFLVVWGADVCWTWIAHDRGTDSLPWLIRAGRWYLLFIAFNGVVVFKSGWLRGLGIAASILLLVRFLQFKRKRSLGSTMGM